MAEPRRSFDAVAELYDAHRPRYPPGLVADLVDRAAVTAQSRILEIAPGTGVLTVPLASTGATVVAVELGPALAAVARRKLAGHPHATVVNAAFEDYVPPRQPFDLVVCATAWHWLDPALRLVRCAEALRPGGMLAVIDTHHIAGGSSAFFTASEECYLRWDPIHASGFVLPAADRIPPSRPDFSDRVLFTATEASRYEVDVAYTAAEYRALLRTYSAVRTLSPLQRSGLLECLTRLIDDHHGGSIVKRYLIELRTATSR